MVKHLIVQGYGQTAQGIPLGPGDEAVAGHLSYHEIPALQRIVGVEDGVVARGLVDHAHEQGRLLYGKVGRLLVEEGLRSRLHSVGAAAEENRVQVHVHDLVLRVVALELHCGYPFLELGLDHHHCGPSRELALHLPAGIERLRELLGDGASASLAGILHQYGLHEHAGEALHVDSGMLVEPGVLGGHRCVHQIGRKLVIAHVCPVLDVEGRQDLAVLGYHLGRQLVVGMLKLLERGYLREEAHEYESEYKNHERRRDDYPEPLDYLFLGTIFHRLLFLPQNGRGQSETSAKLAIKF